MNQSEKSAFSLSDKNIIITGASSGIGRSCAIECSKVGARVILIARDEDRLKLTLNSLHGEGHVGLIFDLYEFKDLQAFLNEKLRAFLPIHGLIHCAGIESTIPLSFLSESNYLDLFRLNVLAGFELAKFISKKSNFDGTCVSLVYISSVMGYLGQEGKIALFSFKRSNNRRCKIHGN